MPSLPRPAPGTIRNNQQKKDIPFHRAMAAPYPVEEPAASAPAPAAATVQFIKENLPDPGPLVSKAYDQIRTTVPDPIAAAARVKESFPDPVAVASAAYEHLPNPRAAAARAASSLRQLADFYDDDYVNLGPTLALGVPIFCFFLAASVFLEAYVLSTATAHLAIFAVGSYVVFSTCTCLHSARAASCVPLRTRSHLTLTLPCRRDADFVADHFMKAYSASYDAIADDKKFYVLSNLIKSAVLLAYTPSCVYTLYRAMALDEWSTPRIRNMGVLYAIPDTVSLLLVTRMAWSTRVHHLCVVGFMVVNLFVTYEEVTVARALVVYVRRARVPAPVPPPPKTHRHPAFHLPIPIPWYLPGKPRF